MPTIDQYDRNNLLLLLQSAEPHIGNQHNAICQILNIRNCIYNEAQNISNKKRHIPGSAIAIILSITLPLCFCFIAPALNSVIADSNIFTKLDLSILIILLFPILIIAIVELIYYCIYKNAVKKYNAKYSTAAQDTQAVVQYIYSNMQQHYELQIIPFTYQNPDILRIVYGYLINFRASNWKEAINLYEQERQLNQLNHSLQQNMQLNYQMMNQELELLKSIQADINFNALATAGLIFFS